MTKANSCFGKIVSNRHIFKENDGVRPLVVIEAGARVVRSPDDDVLPIDESDAVWESPSVTETFCNSPPVFSGGRRHEFGHQDIPDHPGDTGYDVVHSAHSAHTHTVTICNRAVRATGRQETKTDCQASLKLRRMHNEAAAHITAKSSKSMMSRYDFEGKTLIFIVSTDHENDTI
ncbi:uncharacterized protein V6R79_010911 [Siganus canaliculatus]